MYTHNVTNNLGDFRMIVTQNNGFLSVARDKQGLFVPITTVNAKPIISELIEKERAVMFETKRDAA
jgi:hypothetical protein